MVLEVRLLEENYEIAVVSKLCRLAHRNLWACSIIYLSYFVNPYPNIIIIYYVFRFFYTQKNIKIPTVYAIYQGSIAYKMVSESFFYLSISCRCGIDYLGDCIPKEALGGRQSEKYIWIHQGHKPDLHEMGRVWQFQEHCTQVDGSNWIDSA